MNTTKVIKYINGNTIVTIYPDGTKIREYEDTPQINHPESIDIKITNYCDMGCKFCHEQSTTSGAHADLSALLNVLKDLPPGVECAIGGGNPLSHPDLIRFLNYLKAKGLIANITINQGHLKTYNDLIVQLISNELVHGIGISVANLNFKPIQLLLTLTDKIVYHLIAGVSDVNIAYKLMEIDPNSKILLLGYKMFGFGVSYFTEGINENLKRWYKEMPSLLEKCTLSFDNLAIEQLKVKNLLTHEAWEKFYMGDDFQFTMYIDAVKQEFAPTSRSSQRASFKNTSLINYFKNESR